MKKIKEMLALILLLTMVMTTGAYANEGESSLNKINIEFSTESLNYIDSYSTDLTDITNGNLYISTSTVTNISVDYLGLYVELQEKVGASWVKVKTWGTVKKYNSYNISYSAPYEGEEDSQYRVVTTHIIKENGATEVVESISDSIILR